MLSTGGACQGLDRIAQAVGLMLSTGGACQGLDAAYLVHLRRVSSYWVCKACNTFNRGGKHKARWLALQVKGQG